VKEMEKWYNNFGFGLVFIRVYSRCQAGSLNAVGAWTRRNGSSAVCFLVVLLICAWSGTAQAAVMVHVDRFNISENETVNLTIEVTGNDSGEPQTAPLQKNFEILSNNHSSSFSIMNGSTSSKSIYQLMLRPRHAGALTIPPLKVGSALTSPIMIQVNKEQTRTSSSGQPMGDIWISMELSPKKIRVQQQTIITIRIYQAVRLNQAQLTEPTAGNAIIERLGDDNTYQKRENNRSWQVTERHYAMFPQQSGHIEINPVQLDGAVLVGASYFQTTEPVRVRSNSLSLDVSAIPGNWRGEHWLPAKQISLEESWPQSNTTFKVGEPITRTLTLRADGLSASQLPEFSQDLPDHLKAYADKPVLKDEKLSNGVHGMRQEKVAIMPMQAGTYILPEIDIDWWNTATEKTEHATLPPRTFTVIAAAASAPASPRQSQPLKAKVQSQAQAAVVGQPWRASSWWQWWALLASTGWLLTLGYVWQLRRSRGDLRKDSSKKGNSSLKQAEKAVEAACRNNHAKACEQALLSVARLQASHLQCSGSSFNALSALMPICCEALQSEILKLEQALYASSAQTWLGESLLQVYQQEGGFKIPQIHLMKKTAALPELYPD